MYEMSSKTASLKNSKKASSLFSKGLTDSWYTRMIRLKVIMIRSCQKGYSVIVISMTAIIALLAKNKAILMSGVRPFSCFTLSNRDSNLSATFGLARLTPKAMYKATNTG